MADLRDLLAQPTATELDLFEAASTDFRRLVERFTSDGSKLGTLRAAAYLFAADVAGLE